MPTLHPISASVFLVLVVVAAAAVAGDVVDRRAVVPEPDRPHGEVRVIRRDGMTVVQTVLYSRVVRRVAGAIAAKERVNWPAGSEGAIDAARYVEALAEVAGEVRAAGAAGADRRRGLCIEFPASGPVTVGRALVERADDGLRLREIVEPIVTVDVAPAYLDRNRRLIVADAFGVDEATAAAWLVVPGPR